MKCRVTPYEGADPFLFFSYCHSDEALVTPILEYLADQGCRIWYDNGISAGEDWPETIAKKLTECSVFVAAVTSAYCNSHNCKNELTFEVEDQKDIVAMVLEDFSMPLGVRLQLSTTQQVRSEGKQVPVLGQELLRSPKVQPCLGEKPLPPPPEVTITAVSLDNGQIIHLPANGGAVPQIAGMEISFSEDTLHLQNTSTVEVQVNQNAIAPGGVCCSDQSIILCNSSGDTFWIFAQKDSEMPFDESFCYYLCAKSTGEIKIIPRKGLKLGRLHKWLSQVMVDKRIGRDHGRILIKNEQAFLVDCSRNGSYINEELVHKLDSETGKPVAASHALKDGDVIRLSSEEFVFKAIQLIDYDRINHQLYQMAVEEMNAAKNEAEYLSAAEKFKEIVPFGDSESQYHICLQHAEECRNTKICEEAAQLASSFESGNLEAAINLLEPILGWRDADTLKLKLEAQLADIRSFEKKYQEACSLLDSASTQADCEKAEKVFASLKGYRDSEQKSEECRSRCREIKGRLEEQQEQTYKQAIRALLSAQYSEAAQLLESVPGWKDADSLLMLVSKLLALAEPEEITCVLEEYIPDLEATVFGDEVTVREVYPTRSELAFDPRPLIIDLSTGNTYNGNQNSTVVGRKEAQCDIAFPNNERLSRRHFEIFTHNGKHHVRDCNSANGTIIDGRKMDKGETVAFDEQTLVQAAGLKLLVLFGNAAMASRKKLSIGYLHSQTGDDIIPTTTEVTKLQAEDHDATVVAGRTNIIECGQIRYIHEQATVSVTCEGMISVNGHCLPLHAEATVHDGDILQIGMDVFQFRSLRLALKM